MSQDVPILEHTQLLNVLLSIWCLKVFPTIPLIYFLLGLGVTMTLLYNFGFLVIVSSPSNFFPK